MATSRPLPFAMTAGHRTHPVGNCSDRTHPACTGACRKSHQDSPASESSVRSSNSTIPRFQKHGVAHRRFHSGRFSARLEACHRVHVPVALFVRGVSVMCASLVSVMCASFASVMCASLGSDGVMPGRWRWGVVYEQEGCRSHPSMMKARCLLAETCILQMSWIHSGLAGHAGKTKNREQNKLLMIKSNLTCVFLHYVIYFIHEKPSFFISRNM